MNPRVSMIVAMGNTENRVIGRDNGLIWNLPGDLPRFKQLTLGHPVIMGRKTFDSIIAFLGKPLPGRTSIVITRDASWSHEGVVAAHSLEEALEQARTCDTDEVFVIGGGQIYEQALPVTDRMYLTLVEDDAEGDTHFPAYAHLFTKKISEEERVWEKGRFWWITLEREN